MRNYNSFISRSDRYGVFGTNDDKIESLAKQLRYPLEDIMRAIQEVASIKMKWKNIFATGITEASSNM